jgi:glycine cleavage system H protein
LAYDVDRDVWARLERDGTVTLGMTDPAQTRCGKVVNVRFKSVGRRVAANNEAGFKADILAANRDPYGAGWLVRLAPGAWEAERARLLAGPAAAERYRARIDQHKVNCMRCAPEPEGDTEDPDGEG